MNIVGINFACKDNYQQGRHWQTGQQDIQEDTFPGRVGTKRVEVPSRPQQPGQWTEGIYRWQQLPVGLGTI